jgi:hypothetical protein
MVIGEKSHKGMGNAGKDAVGVTMVPMMLLQSNSFLTFLTYGDILAP